MWEALGPRLLAERTEAFAAFVDATLQGPPAGKSFVAGALQPEWIDAAAGAGATPATADITVRDADVWHTFRTGKADALDMEWYRRLPERLAAPDAVLLDLTHADEPAFLLLYPQAGRSAAKLVLRVNYRIKKLGLGNIVETGKLVDPEGVLAQIGRGYTLVAGSL